MMLLIISEITGKTYTFESHVDFVKNRSGYDQRYVMAISKIKKELGWQPAHTFEEGIRSTINWYLSQEGNNWLKSIEETKKEVRKEQERKII